MTAAVDRREWLVSRGLAKPGRGKFSNAAKDALAKAESDGVIFVDKTANVATVKVVNDNGDVVEERREVNPFAQHAEPIRTGYLTFLGENGFALRVNSSEACHSCRYSFGWCYCPRPVFTYWKTGEVLTIARDD